MLGGGSQLLPHAIVTIILMISLIYLFSSDLRENYELTHTPKQQINFYELESGQLSLIKGKQYKFVKATDNKIVVNRNCELEVFRIKFTEVELIQE